MTDDIIARLRVELAKERERADAHYRVLECVSSKRDELRAELADVKSALLSVHGRIRLIEKLAGTDPLIIEECHWCLARIDEALNKGGGDE